MLGGKSWGEGRILLVLKKKESDRNTVASYRAALSSYKDHVPGT